MSVGKARLVVAWVVVASVWSGTAGAQQFGAKGTLAIDAQGGEPLAGPSDPGAPISLTPFVGLDFRRSSEPDSRAENIRTTYNETLFYLNPGVDYFLGDNFSIGGEASFYSLSRSHTDRNVRDNNSEQKFKDPTVYGWSLMPRVGGNLPLSGAFSVWLRGGVGYRSVGNNRTTTTDGKFDDSTVFCFFDALALWHPAPHFFLGVGPGLSLTVYRKWSITNDRNETTSFDGDSLLSFRLLSATIGGWF